MAWLWVLGQLVRLLGSGCDYLWVSGAGFFFLSTYSTAVLGLWYCFYVFYIAWHVVLWHRQCCPFEPSPHSGASMGCQWDWPHLQLQWWALICLEQPSDQFKDGHCRWCCLEIGTEICMEESWCGRLTGRTLMEREIQGGSAESRAVVRLQQRPHLILLGSSGAAIPLQRGLNWCRVRLCTCSLTSSFFPKGAGGPYWLESTVCRGTHLWTITCSSSGGWEFQCWKENLVGIATKMDR